MTPEDRVNTIADRIADGSAIDWPADFEGADPEERATLEALKAIAAVASVHRGPLYGHQNTAAPEATPWGRLTITSKIGEGRFGEVHLAWDARLARRVALKLLFSPSPAASASSEHAIDEARLLARVRHPNVLAVHGAECLNGQVGIWTEFIEGRTLEELLEQGGPMPPASVVDIGADLCRALSAVHDAGLLHRDVKTQNVMREIGGRIVLMDFGTGHDFEARPASAGDLSGTPLYLAPEVLAGGAATQASDIYAVTVLLFRLLTKQYPVPGRTLNDVRTGHRQGSSRCLRQVRPDLPPVLLDAIDRGLAPDPAQRYRSAAEFGTALARVQEVAGSGLSGVGPRARLVSFRRLAGSMAIGLAAVALIAVAAWTLDVAGLRYPPATIQRIRLPQFEMGLASRDGRYMPYVDSAGDLQLWERRTGQSARVTGHRVGEAILMPLMSPRGDRVVYTLQTADGAFELAAVNVDGTSPAVLLSRQTAYTPKPVDWSRDGRDILCLLDQRNRSIDLVLVPAAGGSPSVIHTVQNQVPFHPTLSPDGRFVAYAFTPEQPSQQRDIFIIATTPGASPRPLIAGVANDSGPVWAPDGRSIFFLRESSEHPGESQDGWIFPVSNGAASGEARLVLSNLGPVDLGPMPGLTLADDGTLFYQRTMRSAEINTLSADLTGAVAPGPPTRIEPGSIGDHVAPSWSPDGNSIAYLRTLESPSGGTPLRTLTIKDMVDGRTRQLSPSIPSLGGYKPRWLPDGRSVIVWGWSDDNKVYGYYRVDVRTGRTSMVVGAEKSHWPHPGSFETDGRSFFYSGLGGIVARDLSSGDERIVVPLGDRDEIGRFGLSPNGQVVAFVSTVVSHGTAIYRLEAQTVGGTLRELWRTTEPLRFQTWMPDGRDVLVTNKPTAPNALAQLWRVPTAGGDRRDMHFAIIGNVDNPLSLNPDGRRLAYTERDSYAELVVRQRFWDSREVRKKRWP